MTEETIIPVEFLTTARIGEKGQLTVPKEYRDALQLDTGSSVAVLRLGSGLLLIPEQARFLQLCDRIAKTFSQHDVTPSDLLASLPKARERVFKKYYSDQSSPSPKHKRRAKKKSK